MIPDAVSDLQVLELDATLSRRDDDARLISTVRGTRPGAGQILVPEKMPIRDAIEDLFAIWPVSEAEEWVNQLRRLPL